MSYVTASLGGVMWHSVQCRISGVLGIYIALSSSYLFELYDRVSSPSKLCRTLNLTKLNEAQRYLVVARCLCSKILLRFCLRRFRQNSYPNLPIQRRRSLFSGYVPQGSVLGPLLFSLYVAPIEDIIIAHSLQSMIFADDTQMYLVMQRSQQSF